MKLHRKPAAILVLLTSFGLHQFDAFVYVDRPSTLTSGSTFRTTHTPTFLAAQERYDGKRPRNHNSSNSLRHGKRRSFVTPEDDLTPQDRAWLVQISENVLHTEAGTLIKGKWHELVSISRAWSRRSKFDPEAPLIVERLLKRLLDERTAGNAEAKATTALYNLLLDSWSCAAIFGTHTPARASQRARDILVSLQETFERNDPSLCPDEESFYVVFHAACKAEGPLVARRMLAWMEYLFKSGKNKFAQPSRRQYIHLLDAYANGKGENAGLLTEGFIRHMNATGIAIDTYCYNIAIKAWTRSKRGREAAEHADRILDDMKAPKDLVTYSSVIAAWADSGMRSHAVARAEELLRDIQDSPGLEPNTIVMNSVMSTWVKSRNPAAVNRTAELLEVMEQSTNCRPDLFSYNTHLHALSMHSKRPGYARRASALVEELQRRSHDGERHLRPNLFSYNLVINAWGKAREYDAAWNALKVLRNMIDGQGPQPDTFSFNQVLRALAASSRPGAAQFAERLFEYMIEAYRLKRHKNARPDVEGCASVIVALARSGEVDGTERAESLLNQLKAAHAAGENYLKPTRAVYNALIDCWAKSGRGTYAARRAEALLQEMEESVDPDVAPDIITYNAVLNAWAKSGTRCCANKAEEYLERMWELYDEGRGVIAPNDKSFNTVINAVSKSPNEFKGQKALRILRRMDKLYQAGYKDARPSEVTYTSVLNSCAFTSSLDERTKRKAFDTAIFTLQELQTSRYGAPNDIAYGTFIQACANLLSKDDEMLRAVIEEAFQQCCRDGQVGEMVLYHLRDAAPEDLFNELLSEAFGTTRERIHVEAINIEDLPADWRRNVFRNKERIFGRRTRDYVKSKRTVMP